jgi:hypothetical protein
MNNNNKEKLSLLRGMYSSLTSRKNALTPTDIDGDGL